MCVCVSVQILKTLVVAILVAGVVPLLLGLLFELVIVAPLRVPLDQTPLFYPWQVGVRPNASSPRAPPPCPLLIGALCLSHRVMSCTFICKAHLKKQPLTEVLKTTTDPRWVNTEEQGVT